MTEKVKVLFLASNPAHTSPLALDREIRAITEKIRAAEYRDRLHLISVWAVRPDDILQSLNEHRPHIVHFSGHGTSSGEIVLADDTYAPRPISTNALEALFEGLKDNIQLVVLNACYSKTQAEAITRVIDCAIGMSATIGDEAAIVFAASLYRAIGFGRSIQEAFEQGRIALLLHGIPEDATPHLLAKDEVDLSQLFVVGQDVRQRTHQQDALQIDDVIVQKGHGHIRLDIRLRNSGGSVIDVTRADLHVLKRIPYLAAYQPSASYELLLEDEHNVIAVAHVLHPGEVDRLIVRVGFTKYNTSCGFAAELVLFYNNDQRVVSKSFDFDSAFH